MTLITPTDIYSTWTENARGLEYDRKRANWVLIVADARTGGIREYALTKDTIQRFLESYSRDGAITEKDQEALWTWLTTEKNIQAVRLIPMLPEVSKPSIGGSRSSPVMTKTPPLITR